jgi:hypothetical protein
MSRTIAEQEKYKRICGKEYIVERFIHNRKVGAGIRCDFAGLFDLIAISPREGIIGIQVCGADFSSHYKKITVEKADNACLWLSAGRGRTKIEIWSWRKVLKKRGGKQRIWSPRIKRISYNDLKGHLIEDAA